MNSRAISVVLVSLSALALTGCVGGTTYGTGVSQEAQLIQDLEGMMSMGSKRRKKSIDYSARPDLILPADSAALPAPVDEAASTAQADWPESPEQRLARIRGEAESADPRSGEISVAELKRKKVGIRVLRGKFDEPDIDKDGHAAIDSLNDGSYKNARMLKKSQNTYSTGPRRKYLTEPPVAYRTPYSTAAAGDLGISEAEKERRAEKAAKVKRQNDSGMWTAN